MLTYRLPYYEVDRILCSVFPRPGCLQPRNDQGDCDKDVKIDLSDHQTVVPRGVVCQVIQDLETGVDGAEIVNKLIGHMHRQFYNPSLDEPTKEPYGVCTYLDDLSEGRTVEEVLNVFEEASTFSPEVLRHMDRIRNVFACTFYNYEDGGPKEPGFRQTDFHHLMHILSDIFGTVAGGGEPHMGHVNHVYRYLDSVYSHTDRDCDMRDTTGIPDPRMTPPPFMPLTGEPDDNKNHTSTDAPSSKEPPITEVTINDLLPTRDPDATYPHSTYPTRDLNTTYPHTTIYHTRDPYPTGDPYHTDDPYPTRDPYHTDDPYYTTGYPTYGPEPPPPSICKIRHQFVKTTVAFMKELQCRSVMYTYR